MRVNVYATPYQVIDYLASLESIDLSALEANKKREADLLKAFTIQASRKFDAHCHHRTFYPRFETRYYDFTNDTVLCLDDDLLEVTTLTTQNGGFTIESGNYFLMTGRSYNIPPYDRIELKFDSTQPYFSFSGTTQQSNAVSGFWGYHEEWESAWANSQDTVEDNPLSAIATTITVNDADGADDLGNIPRFQEYQLLRIGSEYIWITAIVGNTLTVIRGVNGTTAAAHDQNTPIYIYQPMPEITNALLTLATHVYRRRSSIGTTADRAVTAGNGIFVLPGRLPDEVTSMMDIFKPL